jgi:hypothetical protein
MGRKKLEADEMPIKVPLTFPQIIYRALSTYCFEESKRTGRPIDERDVIHTAVLLFLKNEGVEITGGGEEKTESTEKKEAV